MIKNREHRTGNNPARWSSQEHDPYFNYSCWLFSPSDLLEIVTYCSPVHRPTHPSPSIINSNGKNNEVFKRVHLVHLHRVHNFSTASEEQWVYNFIKLASLKFCLLKFVHLVCFTIDTGNSNWHKDGNKRSSFLPFCSILSCKQF